MYRLLLVEDRPIYIKGLSEIIREVMGTVDIVIAGSLQQAGERLAEECYQLLICGLPIQIKEARTKFLPIIKRNRSLRILTFTDLADQTIDWNQYQKLYKIGLRGVLSQQASVEEIRKAITEVYKEAVYVSKDVLIGFLMSPEPNKKIPPILSGQESAVAGLLVKGKSNKQMCSILQLHPSTVSTFKNRVFQKLNVHNVLELSKIRWLVH